MSIILSRYLMPQDNLHTRIQGATRQVGLNHGKVLNKLTIDTCDLSEKLMMKSSGNFQGCIWVQRTVKLSESFEICECTFIYPIEHEFYLQL